MKTRLKFLYPNKKTILIFCVLSIVMMIALQQEGTFPENKRTIFYRMVFFLVEPAWGIWLYISAPVLYAVEGIIPQSNVQWFVPQSWELVYGLNFVYYYFVSVAVVAISSLINRRIRN